MTWSLCSDLSNQSHWCRTLARDVPVTVGYRLSSCVRLTQLQPQIMVTQKTQPRVEIKLNLVFQIVVLMVENQKVMSWILEVMRKEKKHCTVECVLILEYTTTLITALTKNMFVCVDWKQHQWLHFVFSPNVKEKQQQILNKNSRTLTRSIRTKLEEDYSRTKRGTTPRPWVTGLRSEIWCSCNTVQIRKLLPAHSWGLTPSATLLWLHSCSLTPVASLLGLHSCNISLLASLLQHHSRGFTPVASLLRL